MQSLHQASDDVGEYDAVGTRRISACAAISSSAVSACADFASAGPVVATSIVRSLARSG
jgi:hypothetical protein